MTWTEVKKTLTTPPPPRPPALKYPLFTTDPFSTKSFGPGHLVGAAVLVGSLYGLTTFFIRRGRAQAARDLQLAQQPQPLQPPVPARTRDDARVAQTANERGSYGSRP